MERSISRMSQNWKTNWTSFALYSPPTHKLMRVRHRMSVGGKKPSFTEEKKNNKTKAVREWVIPSHPPVWTRWYCCTASNKQTQRVETSWTKSFAIQIRSHPKAYRRSEEWVWSMHHIARSTWCFGRNFAQLMESLSRKYVEGRPSTGSASRSQQHQERSN